jgi:hypothetical protein
MRILNKFSPVRNTCFSSQNDFFFDKKPPFKVFFYKNKAVPGSLGVPWNNGGLCETV